MGASSYNTLKPISFTIICRLVSQAEFRIEVLRCRGEDRGGAHHGDLLVSGGSGRAMTSYQPPGAPLNRPTSPQSPHDHIISIVRDLRLFRKDFRTANKALGRQCIKRLGIELCPQRRLIEIWI